MESYIVIQSYKNLLSDQIITVKVDGYHGAIRKFIYIMWRARGCLR